ncbi:helix-turn-helix domain-containing protein [Novosphingobium sp. BL-8H]|uniref:helix-turn-helix domain-containing protein n=1 Tax=Novosphingobium sp. BL-8H TaxID=3127640 RepID=UPI003756FA44
MEQISVRISDAVRLTGLSRTKIYQLISHGDLEVAKIGRSTVIIASSLREFVGSRRTRHIGARS